MLHKFSLPNKREDASRVSLSHFARKTTAILLSSLAATLLIGAAAQADGVGAVAPVPQTSSFKDLQDQYWKAPAVQAGTEEHAENRVKESGSGTDPKYSDQPQGGTEDTSTSGFTETASPPQTNAQQPQPNQSVPHPVIQPISTIYGNPMLNHWGPPRYPLPFQVYGLHNPEPNKDMLNPATFKNTPYLTGAHISDLVQNTVTIEAAKRGAQQLLNPSYQSAQAGMQAGTQQGADGAQGSASGEFSSNLQTYRSSLINVANEAAGVPTAADAPHKTLEQAIWMVQQMYKRVFIPMAILFLLPGAVLTQTMSVVRHGFRNPNPNVDENTTSGPFVGILRALIAVFLIPATQLIVSYSIDVGNSMTYEVTQFLDAATITSWEQSLSLAHPTPPNATPYQKEQAAQQETTMNSTMRMGFSAINTLLNGGLMILLAYQVVIACYLFLLGPIAACLFAWPGGVGKLFKPVFSNWLEALLNLVLWRFWWCVILLCMATRIQWLMETGQYNPGSQWENFTYLAFMAMLTYVPFMALDFKTDQMVDQLLEKTGGSAQGGGDKAGGEGAGHHQSVRPRAA